MFNENWYSDSQIKDLIKTVKIVRNLKGKFIEIGCWEGKSTVAIANACFPEYLDAVDTWRGSINEECAIIASQRDVFQSFKDNISTLTKGNVVSFKQDCFEYFNALCEPVKFCHIDASHDYESVKKTIGILLPKLVNNAILCGDDYCSAHIHRKDLNGGVQRAVIEMCPFHTNKGNLWVYRHSTLNRFIFRLTVGRCLIMFIRNNFYKLRVLLSLLKRSIM